MTADGLAHDVLAWLMSYAIHSTILLGGAWAFTRVRTVHPATADIIWKSALIGGLVTATLQGRFDLRPSGSIALAPAAIETTPLSGAKATGTPAPRTERAASPSVGDPAPALNATDSSLPMTTIAVIGWAAVALLLAAAYAARRLILVGRLGDRQVVRELPVMAIMGSLAEKAGWKRRVVLTASCSISSPVALGVSEVCLPVAALTDLDAEQQRSMLAHELAHLVRRDPVWLDIASVMERIFFFQPLNRRARREMQAAAEYLCDDWAARHTGSGLPLARCLAKVAEWIQASPLGVPLAGMAEQRSLLVSRIARLIDPGGAAAPRSRGTLALLAGAVLCAMVFIAPRVAGRGVAGGSGESLPVGAPADTSSQPTFLVDRGDADPQPDPDDSGEATPAATVVDTGVVTALIARLNDDDAAVRQAAAHSLGRLEDPRAIGPLIAALRDRDASVRAAAADAIGDFEDARAIGPLADLLADRDRDVRQNALSALSRFEQGVPAEPVIRLLEDEDADVRHEAAHLLAQIGDRSAIDPLTRLARDPSPEVREAAIGALSELRDPSVGQVIIAALNDPHADVRREALNAADNLKIPVPDPTVLTLLRDAAADVRTAAAALAGERSMSAAISELQRMLADPSSDVRESAIDALSEIVHPAARTALQGALNSTDAKVRRRAAEALGERN